MFEELNQHRAAVAENIQKATEIGFTGNELEKAHKVGDVHPNGKWVWTQLPSGRYDWRVIKRTSGGSAPAAPATAQKKPISISANHPAFSGVAGVDNVKEYLTTFNSKYTDLSKVTLSRTPKGNWDVRYDGHRLGILNGDQIPESSVKKMGWIEKEEKSSQKPSAFVKSTIDFVKNLAPKVFVKFDSEKEKKMMEAIASDEEGAKKIMKTSFPVVASVGPGISYDKNENSLKLGDGSELVFESSKSYDSTSRNPAHAGSVTTKYNIYLKRSISRKVLGFSDYTTGSRWGGSASEAKNKCRFYALFNYFKIDQ